MPHHHLDSASSATATPQQTKNGLVHLPESLRVDATTKLAAFNNATKAIYCTTADFRRMQSQALRIEALLKTHHCFLNPFHISVNNP
jgi:hypothetical protein